MFFEIEKPESGPTQEQNISFQIFFPFINRAKIIIRPVRKIQCPKIASSNNLKFYSGEIV